MAARPTFRPIDYYAYVRFSAKIRLLVEGADDHQAFHILFDEVDNERGNDFFRRNVDIDNAEQLIDFPMVLGNREKVEYMCQQFVGDPDESKIAGFVDREFREFAIGSTIVDNLIGERIENRLVWSRGHSFENYIFCLDGLRPVLRDFSTTNYFPAAIDLFEKCFSRLIRLATASSLAGLETDKLSLVKGITSWKIFDFTKDGLDFKVSEVINELKKRGYPEAEAVIVTDRIAYWKGILEAVDDYTVRWLCHGHIGFATIWAVYGRCVFEVTQSSTEVSKVAMASERLRLNALTSSWVRLAVKGRVEFPQAIINLLVV